MCPRAFYDDKYELHESKYAMEVRYMPSGYDTNDNWARSVIYFAIDPYYALMPLLQFAKQLSVSH